MNLPTITELAKAQARFVKYQDGKLWYSIVWCDPKGEGDERFKDFEFPIGVDLPALYDVVDDAADALEMISNDTLPSTIPMCADTLRRASKSARTAGAGEGEFRATMKGIEIIRWARQHLEFLRTSLEGDVQ